MADRKFIERICVICFALGVVVPWLLLGAGAIIPLFNSSAYWGETAAYLSAAGVIWLGLVYLLANITNRLPH